MGGRINLQPAILYVGIVTRLWLLSRSGFPKQFLCLKGDESLFQLTAKRLMGLGATYTQVHNPIVVSNEKHRFLASKQLREAGISLGAALLEPVRRNTAPALTLTALTAHHCDENWVVVKGTTEITYGDKTITLTEDQSTYIPLGEVRRLANQGTILLKIIEVQSGSYLGEDDIIRFDDHFGRTGP